ncbi:DUF397 domain-containing protein [Streptomyces sp. NPDC005438]|uniref:DUF397 domain-containing protein n=1 Tax=Streptomyces sp. NPDC005438 TaxID=3156880 RepID=UPI0033B9E8EB
MTSSTLPDASTLAGWRKSSYSGGDHGSCLEVAHHPTTVPVRDSKNPTGPALLITPTAWTTFTTHLKHTH